jgi:F0F1-type ATP synthase assembly protein I
MALCLGLCTWLGSLADARWHTGPFATVAGALLGTAAAFYGVFREVARVEKLK